MQRNRIEDHPKSETRSLNVGECELSGGEGIDAGRGIGIGAGKSVRKREI